MLTWLRTEIVALAGVVGAALSVLSQLVNVLPMTPALSEALAWWRRTQDWLLHPPFEAIGVPLHPHVVGATSAAFFMALIGAGARISRQMSANPLPPLTAKFRCFDDMTWPSLIVFVAIFLAFLFGQDATPNRSPPVMLFGSDKLGQYVLSVIVTGGYWAGDFLGHREFHQQLFRLAALVVGVIGVDFAARAVPL